MQTKQDLLTKTCRTCAKFYDAIKLIPIFDEITITTHLEGEYKIYKELDLFDLQIEKGDDLPQHICFDCLQNLKNICDFRENCKKSQSELKILFDSINLETMDNEGIKVDNYITTNKDEVIENMTEEEENENSSTEILYLPIEEDLNEDVDDSKDEMYNVEFLFDIENDPDVKEEKSASVSEKKRKKNTKIDTKSSAAIKQDEDEEDNESVNGTKAKRKKTKNSGKATLTNPKIKQENKNSSNIMAVDVNSNKYIYSSRIISDRRMYLRLKNDNDDDKKLPIDLINSLDNMNTTTNDMELFSCFYCDEDFNTKHLIEDHIMKTHNESIPFVCKICKKSFSNMHKRKLHIESHITEKNHKCEYCSKLYPHEHSLIRHIRLKHTDSNYKCELCSRTFYYAHSLRKHFKVHDNDTKYKCNYCDKIFKTYSYYKFHEEIHTNAKNPYKCEECDETFIHEADYKFHKRIHNETTKIAICEICGKGFPPKSLNDHKEQHVTEMKCKICGKQYYTMRRFKEHQILHFGKRERKFECDLCDKKFYTKSNLKDHKVVHTDEKPFQCTMCGATFRRYRALSRHMEICNEESCITQKKIKDNNLNVEKSIEKKEIEDVKEFQEEDIEIV